MQHCKSTILQFFKKSKYFKTLNGTNIISILKNSVNTVQSNFKNTVRPSFAYIIDFLPFALTVLLRTLPGLCHSNMLTRSCLPLVAHTSFWIISCFFPTLLSFPLWHGPYFLTWFCPRRYTSSLHADLVNLSTDARLPEFCL